MPNGRDFFARPLLRGMCTLAELKDGTLDLADIAFLNDCLDAEAENQFRAAKAAEAARKT